jgi:excisionase family DNA binding protein
MNSWGNVNRAKEEANMTNQKNLLRSKDVAHILDVSPDYVIELASKGKLKATKEGRFWRFRPAHVMDYKKRQELKG